MQIEIYIEYHNDVHVQYSNTLFLKKTSKSDFKAKVEGNHPRYLNM